jgi:hypothetical protein
MPEETTTTQPASTTTSTTVTAPVTTGTAPAATATQSFDWKSLNLPPELQLVVDRHQFDGPATILKSYDALERFHGVPPDRMLKLPTDKDGPDAWKPIFQKLGMPETSDKYVVPVPEGDKGDFAKVAREWFHGANMTQSQVTKVAEQWNSFQAAQAKEQQAAIESRNLKDVTDLKTAWGPDYDKNSELVDKAAEAFGLDQTILDALKQAAGPKKAMEFLHNIGKKMGAEATNVPGMSTGSSNATMTPEMAKAEIQRLKNDKTYAKLMFSEDPQQKMDARNQMRRLTEIAYPGSTLIG